MRELLCLLLGVVTLSCGGAPTVQGKRVIGVITFVSHPVAADTERGFEEALAKAGVTDVEFDFQNAHGDTATAFQIAQKFANDRVALVHTMTTPASQAVVTAVKGLAAISPRYSMRTLLTWPWAIVARTVPIRRDSSAY